MSQYFGGPKPPENLSVVLGPGEKYPFEESFLVELPFFEPGLNPYFRELIAARNKDPKKRQHAIEYFSNRGLVFENFQLSYEFSFLDKTPDPDFLEKMSQRWKGYGIFPVDKNGIYSIVSAPIK